MKLKNMNLKNMKIRLKYIKAQIIFLEAIKTKYL